MRIVVTGGTGRVGSRIVLGLVRAGHRVVSVDARPGKMFAGEPGVEHHILDLTLPGSLNTVARDAEAIVHLAAIPRPLPEQGQQVFATNVLGTYSVFQTAADLGIDRVVAASSVAALGRAWAQRPAPPDRLPIDEDHPLRPAEHYGLSKLVVEQIGLMFARETSMVPVLLRFPWVAEDQDLLARVAAAHADPVGGPWFRDLWSYVRLPDLLEAIERGATRSVASPAVVTVVGPDTLLRTPTRDLVATHLPDIPVHEAISGNRPLWSTKQLESVLGMTPQHSWRDLGEEQR